MEKNNLEGKVAIITGGSSGIGKAIASLLARKGAHLVLVARNERRLKAVVESLEGDKHSYEILDLEDADQIEGLVKKVHTRYNHIDILVNNAGGFDPGSILEIDYPILDKRNAELKGGQYFTKAVAPIFQKQNSGMIIDILSTAAIDVLPGNNAYAATKVAQRFYSLVAEQDLKKYGVNVFRIYPGGTKTPLWGKNRNRLKEEIGNGPQLSPNDIAEETYNLISTKREISHDLLIMPNSKGEKIVKYIGKYDFGPKVLE